MALQMVRCLGSDTSVTGSHHHNPLEGLGFGEATNTPALPDLPTLQEQLPAHQPEFFLVRPHATFLVHFGHNILAFFVLFRFNCLAEVPTPTVSFL